MNDKPQVDKFRDLARQLGTDDDEGRFDERLKRVATAVRPARVWDPDGVFDHCQGRMRRAQLNQHDAATKLDKSRADIDRAMLDRELAREMFYADISSASRESKDDFLQSIDNVVARPHPDANAHRYDTYVRAYNDAAVELKTEILRNW